jgi:4-amino-4-deoxy-L-arabinose transferase-like glycosyltransferase
MGDPYSPIFTMVVSNVSILSILNILNIQNMLIILKCSNSLKHEVWFPWLFQYVPMSPWLLWRSRLGLSERSRLTRQARDGENCSEREGHLKWV